MYKETTNKWNLFAKRKNEIRNHRCIKVMIKKASTLSQMLLPLCKITINYRKYIFIIVIEATYIFLHF